MKFMGGINASHKQDKAMGKKYKKTFKKTDFVILKGKDSNKYQTYLKVQKKTTHYESYFFVEEKSGKEEYDAFWVASDKYESDYLSFLFNSVIGKELLFGDECNPYIDNDIAKTAIESFKVIDVSREKQEKYGCLERQIQNMIEQQESFEELDKLQELRDALAVELYDSSFLHECHTDLFDKWQASCWEEETMMASNLKKSNSEDWLEIVEYINLVSDDVIKDIIKEIRG